LCHVHRAIALGDDNIEHEKGTKLYSGDRYILYPQYVVDLINRQGYVTNLNLDQITSKFERILRHAGIPHFRFHDLRHYSASIQHALNIPDAYIMARGGWGSDQTLKSIYRHAMDSETQRMNKKVNRHFEKILHQNCTINKKTTKKPAI
jgi:integrase